MYSRKDYQFTLPKSLIAETAAHPAHSAKMMVVSKSSGKIVSEWTFWDLGKILTKNTVLFFNNSRVIRARIPLQDTKVTTDKWEQKSLNNGEIFFLQKTASNTFEALVRPGKKFRVWTQLQLWKYTLTVSALTKEWRIFEIQWGAIEDCLEEFGKLPLPPYIEYSEEKEKDYQSIFAEKSGSVAAPTASLHFTNELMKTISSPKEYVTLHIGMGTFKWVDTEDIRHYHIHSERAEVSRDIFNTLYLYKTSDKTITAVGTTACRTLESLPSVWKKLSESIQQSYSSECQNFWNELSKNAKSEWTQDIVITSDTLYFSTEAYIVPGVEFLIIDELITNFHLPESSLLMLVGALIGYNTLIEVYKYAIHQWYRFFSFWDGMYITK